MLGTDSVDILILTCWPYEVNLSDLETWFIRLFSYVSRNQVSVQKHNVLFQTESREVKIFGRLDKNYSRFMSRWKPG
jgi:hypothetical protein